MQRGEDVCEVHVLHVATWCSYNQLQNCGRWDTLMQVSQKYWYLFQTTWLQSSCQHH